MKKREVIILTIVICLLVARIFIKVYKQDDSYAVDAFKENTVYIETENNVNNFDVSSLKKIFKENEIIGLGDSTIGVKEFDSIKLEMLKTAVEDENYRILALQVDFGLGQYINDHVHGKEDITIEKIMSKSPWIFKNKGLIDMIQWVKQYNDGCSEKNKVSIYGINTWDIEGVPVDILNYLTLKVI